MVTRLTRGNTVMTPHLMTGYNVSRQTGNKLHPILGRNWPDVTFGPYGTREGKLSFVVLSLDAAQAIEAFVATPGIIFLTDTDHPQINMPFVWSGSFDLALDAVTRKVWLITFDFHEVVP